ncbi:NADPH:adrenodoxin oxidoreductase, mitochondrial isoform X1 [Nicotiana tabacum]|uniref:NADPH:adrenodoxin oxidoreductase, mitochondrial n=1 Tax=Nicotiana tabacum TaxID=4097 RepID=A0A1S4CZD9_TOBAC|nr:PREDICTED: NADPH:adrenodoxin oxidoreductase, mitochondrial-like isoform X1 [Nicotiana tabacum]XP_016506508.1 PREDICTED: NADPH:adrenodoxin oxidoreductase, mitochondrial-like isoform X1 [Nicotiana tabacum]
MAVSRALRRFWRTYSTVSSERLRFCIVGSGPAGFYTADKILKAHKRAEVDIVDRLPTPFGLVRSGVAPDHPDTKIVTNQFSRVVQNGRCSFIGNVSIGISISLAELRELYDVVVLSYGAESDQALGIAGEELAGIYAAREFVWWYNGHPDCRNLAPDLKSSDTAVIIGQGNVALDVARILLRPTSELATTDIASHALAALEESSIRKVYLVGRRGAAQAAFTAKELREVLGIKDLFIEIQQADLSKTPADEEELKSNRIKRRIHELLSKAATSAASVCSPGKKELHFVFFRKPDRFLESDCRSGHVAGLRLERTILKEDAGSGRQIAVGTGLFDEMECGLVLKSVGYKSRPVDGLPFDLHKGIVPNVQGRVLSEASGDALVEKGLYACGWLKRGPTGIIATNLYCAEETVASILEDIQRGLVTSSSGLSKPGRDGLLQLLDSRNVKIVPFGGWEKIDSEEKRRGSLKNKPREKLTSWQELLEVAAK